MGGEMWLKMCLKCRGDLYLRHEIEGKDIVCLQCGHSEAYNVEDHNPPDSLGLERDIPGGVQERAPDPNGAVGHMVNVVWSSR